MKLAIAGAGGRMGRVLTRIIQETEGCTVAGGLEPKGSPLVGTSMGETGAIITDDPGALFKNIDGIVDFTVPAATLSLVEFSAGPASCMSSAPPALMLLEKRRSGPPEKRRAL